MWLAALSGTREEAPARELVNRARDTVEEASRGRSKASLE